MLPALVQRAAVGASSVHGAALALGARRLLSTTTVLHQQQLQQQHSVPSAVAEPAPTPNVGLSSLNFPKVVAVPPARPNTFPLGRKVYALVHLAGFNYDVSVNDVIVVNKLKGVDVGQRIQLDQVLSVRGPDFALYGQPHVSSEIAQVQATVIEQAKAHKVIIFKHRRRKNSQRTRGHRQQITALRISKISTDLPAAVLPCST